MWNIKRHDDEHSIFILFVIAVVQVIMAFARNADFYAPNFEKVDGAYCFWSVR